MGRPARSLLGLLLLFALVAACATAAGTHRAQIRRVFDEARIAHTPAEIWPEVQRFLDQMGYPLVGNDRLAVGKPAQGAIARLFSTGFETRVLADGSRVLETGPQGPARTRVRVEATPVEGGGSHLRVRVIKRAEMDEIDTIESRDPDLELALLERLDHASAARVTGQAPRPAAAATVTGRKLSAPPTAAAARQPAPTVAAGVDRWARMRPLLGSWTGELPDGTPVGWRFDFASDSQFIEVRGTPFLFADASGRAGGEEMGRISSAADGARLMWNQFTNAGRVDRYEATTATPASPTAPVTSPSPPTEASASSADVASSLATPAATITPAAVADEPLVFVAQALESLPAGARVRLTLRRIGDQLETTLDIAEPGKDFALAGSVLLSRAP